MASDGDRTVVKEHTYVERRRWTTWVAGFVAALVVVAIAVGAFLVLSDSDDDGSVDVPSVEVDTDGNSVDVQVDE
jgi:hypothetical protein